MDTLAPTQGPSHNGWLVPLTDSHEDPRFTDLGAKRRALRYLASHDVIRGAEDVR